MPTSNGRPDRSEQHTNGRSEQPEEVRPVRLLVPTDRRGDYGMPHDDTLLASELGVTRHTTDDELLGKVADATQAVAGISHEDPLEFLRRVRDALRQPRDITEARAWGLEIPRAENSEEFSASARKRLGWWWVYDTSRTETRDQRQARYLGDRRLLDMKGFARVLRRAYITIKDIKFTGDNVRMVLDDPAHLELMARAVVEQEPSISLDDAKAGLISRAREDVLKALPPRRDRAGQSDLWYVCDALKFGRSSARLDWWYEYNRIKQTGRPLGSRTRTRRAPV